MVNGREPVVVEEARVEDCARGVGPGPVSRSMAGRSPGGPVIVVQWAIRGYKGPERIGTPDHLLTVLEF